MYSVEVETVLYQHPAVQECAVIGIPSEAWGEAVHAVVVPRPGVTVSDLELIEFVRSHIAHYKAPKSCEIRTAELPKSGAGKILKTEVKKPYWESEERGIQ